MYYKRTLEKIINKIKDQYPCITIYGARQVGKSTLIYNMFGDSIEAVSLDSSDIRANAEDNPRLFLEDHPWPLIIDEIQKCPKLLEEIKVNIDNVRLKCLKENIKEPLMYILTGSNQIDLRKKVSDSLAGRTAILNLSSLANNEIEQVEGNIFEPSIDVLKSKYKNLNVDNLYKTRKEIFEKIFKGGMPKYVIDNLDREIYFSSYITSYLEKDISRSIEIGKEAAFLRFLQYMALRTAQQINYDDIARNVGIDARTVSNWISLLVTSGIAFVLQPYARNLSNRVTKSNKFYFFDTGLCAYLCKWQDANMLENGAMSGAFFETYCVSELTKSFINNGVNPNGRFFYYRDKDKKETDLIIEYADYIVPIEIKKGINPVSSSFNFRFLEKYNKKVSNGLVIDSRKDIVSINKDNYQIPVFMIGI